MRICTHHVGVRIQLLTGADALGALSERLDDLHAATDCPVTARRPWLSTWLSCYQDQQPVALLVEGADGRLEGAALLARRCRMGMTQVVAMGHGPSDDARLPVRSAEAAEELARALAQFLTSIPRPWRLLLRHLQQDDPVITGLADRLRYVELVPGSVSPVTRFNVDRSLRAHVSRNHFQQVKRMRNRISREGLSADIAHLTKVDDVAAVLDEVERLCHARDIQKRGWSAMQHTSAGPFFRSVVLDHADRGEVELTTLRLDGELAAYVLCFRDGDAYRMWSCRVAPAWLRYGAGRLANNAALEHALSDQRYNAFDWMRGDEEYKHSMANHIERSQDVFAWSSLTVKAVTDAPRRLKALLVLSAERHPAAARVLPRARRLYQGGRRIRRRLASLRPGSRGSPAGGLAGEEPAAGRQPIAGRRVPAARIPVEPGTTERPRRKVPTAAQPA
jgi:CelD/BcsL family acetyltransferase involved in cellulose biosynthesis